MDQLIGGLDQRRQGHGSPPAQGRGAVPRQQGFLDLDGNAQSADAIPDDGIGAWPRLADIVHWVGDRTLTLTNLDKVLYPSVGFTKAEVIDYYLRIAPVMLPLHS